MNEIILELISQFGISGVILALVGYIAWDRYKANQRKSNGVDGASKNHKAIEKLGSRIDIIEEGQRKLDKKLDDAREVAIIERENLDKRLDVVENTLQEIRNPNPAKIEARNIQILSQRYPMIHKILGNSMDNIECDHIAIGHVHNGMKGVTGIPFIKCSIVAERYDPLIHPEDVELATKYQGEDLMRHNLLPMTVMQHNYVHFDVTKNSNLKDIDLVFYQRCIKDGIRELAFHTLRTHDGLIFGFIACYSFDQGGKMNEEEIKQTASLLEEVYNS